MLIYRTWMRSTVSVSVAALALAAGALAATPALGAASDDAYRAAIAEGRKLEKQGDHAGAVGAFQAAVAAHPDDPVALSELGWAAFLTKDLTRAAESTERAIAVAKDPRLKAASLYNLGRIEEERGAPARALELYQQSLALRPNAAVQKRLSGLKPDAAVPAAPDRSQAPLSPSGRARRSLSGTWRCEDPDSCGKLLTKDRNGKIEFQLMLRGELPENNTGFAEGHFVVKDGFGAYETTEFDGQCRIEFSFADDLVEIKQTEGGYFDCGFGRNVFANGKFSRTSDKVPKFKN